MTAGPADDDAPESDALLDWRAIWPAALSAATIAVPLGLLQQWLRETGRTGQSDPLNLLIFLGILCAGALAGFGAAKGVRSHALPNGAAAAALAYVSVQGIGVVRRLIVGEDISSPVGWIYLMLLMATCGMLGAALERRSKPLREGRSAVRTEES